MLFREGDKNTQRGGPSNLRPKIMIWAYFGPFMDIFSQFHHALAPLEIQEFISTP